MWTNQRVGNSDLIRPCAPPPGPPCGPIGSNEQVEKLMGAVKPEIQTLKEKLNTVGRSEPPLCTFDRPDVRREKSGYFVTVASRWPGRSQTFGEHVDNLTVDRKITLDKAVITAVKINIHLLNQTVVSNSI